RFVPPRALSPQHVAPVLAWAGAVLGGFWLLLDYQATPGAMGPAPAHWPADSRLERPAGTYHLVLFAHPRCPCTRATLAELARVMARCDGRLSAEVRFYRPAAAWAETD